MLQKGYLSLSKECFLEVHLMSFVIVLLCGLKEDMRALDEAGVRSAIEELLLLPLTSPTHTLPSMLLPLTDMVPWREGSENSWEPFIACSCTESTREIQVLSFH